MPYTTYKRAFLFVVIDIIPIHMPDEVTFMDIASLLSITPDTTLEKLGRMLNTSIFDISNIAGTMKQKGLIEFTSFYPGPTSMTVTDAGKALIAEADARSAEPIDMLDDAILDQLAGGRRIPLELQNTLNVRPKDLALRLYKLSKQGFLIYDIKSGGVELLLTEKGFLKAKAGQKISAPSAPRQQTPEAQAASQVAAESEPAQKQKAAEAQAKPAVQKKGIKAQFIIVITIIIVIIALAVVYYYKYRV